LILAVSIDRLKHRSDTFFIYCIILIIIALSVFRIKYTKSTKSTALVITGEILRSCIVKGSNRRLFISIFKNTLNYYLGWLAIETEFNFDEPPDGDIDG